MCKHGTTKPALVMKADGSWDFVDVDACIQPIIESLNVAGLVTIASCCGHGNRPGNIALADGREIIVTPDFETARRVDDLFPNIHGEDSSAMIVETELLERIWKEWQRDPPVGEWTGLVDDGASLIERDWEAIAKWFIRHSWLLPNEAK